MHSSLPRLVSRDALSPPASTPPVTSVPFTPGEGAEKHCTKRYARQMIGITVRPHAARRHGPVDASPMEI